MQPSLPLVSICIPVYNTEKYIGETLDCVLNQTYKNVEIIFSDNCCTDATIQIIEQRNDPRIKIFHNSENIGLVPNFRKVLTYATGKYIMFLGADDGIDLTAVEKGVAILEDPKYQDIMVVNTHIKIINDESKVIATKKFPIVRGKLSSWWAIRSTLFYGFNIIGEPNGSLFRTDAYKKIPEPKFKNGCRWTLDMDMKNEFFLQGPTYVIPEALGMFRISAQSNSNANLRFEQAKLYRQYAFRLYKDKRYHLSFLWMITATINSFILQIVRNLFYVFFIKNK
jgi:glycosyltransferase involved in cell wall biosynthesis